MLAELAALRKEGFQLFMVCQTRVRDEGKREHTKHMLRLRYASRINGVEANEIVLLNSHRGTSSYQMLAGMFRFVCSNGLVCGDTVANARGPHKGDVSGHVIEGPYEVLRGFDRVKDSRDAMRAITLHDSEAEVFARSALALKYDRGAGVQPRADQGEEAALLRRRQFQAAHAATARAGGRAVRRRATGPRRGLEWPGNPRRARRISHGIRL